MDDDGYINDVHHTFWDGFENQSGWALVNQYGTTLPSGTDTFKYYFNNPTLVNSGTYSGQVHNPENLIKGNQEIRILERDRDNWIIIDNPTATEYTYSAWVYSNGPNVNLTLKMKSSSGYITETIGVGTTTRMEWVKLEGTVNVPANIVSLNIQLKNMGQRPNTTGYTVWYDDVSIKKTGSEIVEEDNYYPFGLKHKGYNIAVNGGNDKAQKYKYQGQERNDEMGLNWDSFKWRNYDYAIGRFMSIDPLAEKYAYQSPYNFSENRVIDSRELEGLEKVSIHLLGEITLGDNKMNLIGSVQIDMGNNNEIKYGYYNISTNSYTKGTYTQGEGNSMEVFEGPPSDLTQMQLFIKNPGAKIPDGLATWGIEKVMDKFVNPQTVEEALSLSEEDKELNKQINFALTGAGELIDSDVMDAFYSYDGSFSSGMNKDGTKNLRKFTRSFSGKIENIDFSNDDYGFKGTLVLTYTEQETVEKSDKDEEK